MNGGGDINRIVTAAKTQGRRAQMPERGRHKTLQSLLFNPLVGHESKAFVIQRLVLGERKDRSHI